jgi:hypothetical protein
MLRRPRGCGRDDDRSDDMTTRPKGSRSRLRGAAQLELFPRETLAACVGPPARPRTNQGDVVLQEVADDGPGTDGGTDRAGGFTLVAVWHDRRWEPVRVFRRADGASVVVFKVDAA